MASNRPCVQLWIRSKDTGNNINLAAMWDGEYGLSGKFADDQTGTVKGIVIEMPNGKEVTVKPDQVWLNGKLETQYLAQALTAPANAGSVEEVATSQAAGGDDDIPF